MKERMFLSGYTKKNNDGIHCIEFDSMDFKEEYDIEKIKHIWTIKSENPSYMCFSGNKEIMFSITSKENGGVISYIKSGDSYKECGSILNMGKAPCHLFYDDFRNLLYSSNYHLGKLDIIKVDPYGENKGSMTLLKTIRYHGNSIVYPNQDSSKCHMAITDNEGNNIVVVNLGADEVYTYKIEYFPNDKLNGKIDNLQEKSGEEQIKVELVSIYKSKPGMGPRHIVFGKNGRFAYLLGELDSHIEILSYKKDKGIFYIIDRIKTLPDGFKGGNSASAIKISSDGKYLYSSNRGHDSISVFKIKDDGMLKLVQIENTNGRTPRDFSFNNDESLVIIGYQDDNFVEIYLRDADSGKICLVDNGRLDYSEIVCIIK